MRSTGNNQAFTLPPTLLAEVKAAAQEEYRAVEDFVRDVVERYLAERRAVAASPARRTPAEAAARILSHRPRRRLPEGETIRSMIDHGRS